MPGADNAHMHYVRCAVEMFLHSSAGTEVGETERGCVGALACAHGAVLTYTHTHRAGSAFREARPVPLALEAKMRLHSTD